MPPMPPPGGMAGPAAGFFGSSATMASVVIGSAATEAAFWIATRTTLDGSMQTLNYPGPITALDKPQVAVEVRRNRLVALGVRS